MDLRRLENLLAAKLSQSERLVVKFANQWRFLQSWKWPCAHQIEKDGLKLAAKLSEESQNSVQWPIRKTLAPFLHLLKTDKLDLESQVNSGTVCNRKEL